MRKMSPAAQAAADKAARWFSTEMNDENGNEPEIMETMTGGRAFIAVLDGVRLAVTITEQDREDGPLMSYEPRESA
jgi:hypothetical protein